MTCKVNKEGPNVPHVSQNTHILSFDKWIISGANHKVQEAHMVNKDKVIKLDQVLWTVGFKTAGEPSDLSDGSSGEGGGIIVHKWSNIAICCSQRSEDKQMRFFVLREGIFY